MDDQAERAALAGSPVEYVMPDVRWFTVDLQTLSLKQTKSGAWPPAMKSTKSRMCEECLESLVALNLDILFENEELLLIDTQSQMVPMADVMAIDTIGILRLMELKKTPVSRSELENQVISYGVRGHELHAWPNVLARALTDMPEKVALMMEGFCCNERAKAMSSKVAEAGRNRFERAALKAASLRARRKGKPMVSALNDEVVRQRCHSLFGTPSNELAWGDPAQLAEQIVRRSLGAMPSLNFFEFTMIAPGIADAELSTSALEKRRACFNLIDADLRCNMKGDGVQSAILRWEPVHRTIKSDLRNALASLRHALLEAGDTRAADFRWLPERERICWPHLATGIYLYVTEYEGTPYLSTWGEWITEGLAPLKPKLIEGLRRLAPILAASGVEPEEGGHLGVALTPKTIDAACRLAKEYHSLASQLGFDDPFRWQKRPKAPANP